MCAFLVSLSIEKNFFDFCGKVPDDMGAPSVSSTRTGQLLLRHANFSSVKLNVFSQTHIHFPLPVPFIILPLKNQRSMILFCGSGHVYSIKYVLLFEKIMYSLSCNALKSVILDRFARVVRMRLFPLFRILVSTISQFLFLGF